MKRMSKHRAAISDHGEHVQKFGERTETQNLQGTLIPSEP